MAEANKTEINIHTQSIKIEIEAPYFTYGNKGEKTNEIWLVCHGYGQLACRFVRRFNVFDPEQHLVIAPQGLSKFYLPDRSGVGATWMTRENRLVEIDNYLHYIDSVFDTACEGLDLNACKINLLGFSQGGATMSRWAAHRQIAYDRMIFWAGDFAHELEPNALNFGRSNAEIIAVLGDQDQFITEDKVEPYLKKMRKGIPNLRVHRFHGKHELLREELKAVIAGKINS